MGSVTRRRDGGRRAARATGVCAHTIDYRPSTELRELVHELDRTLVDAGAASTSTVAREAQAISRDQRNQDLARCKQNGRDRLSGHMLSIGDQAVERYRPDGGQWDLSTRCSEALRRAYSASEILDRSS